MKKRLLTLILGLCITGVNAQKTPPLHKPSSLQALGSQEEYKMRSIEGNQIICPASHFDENTFIDMPEVVKRAYENSKNARANGSAMGPAATQSAQILVDYDPAMPENAKAAFQRAIDIWAQLLNSEVPIRVAASWRELGSNILGSAGPGTYYVNSPGVKKRNTWYPIALAEKLAGIPLNSDNDYDIFASFSSQQNWYYGTTGTPAVGQFDFTSVVLHELCHGLGFVGSMTVEGTQGSYGSGNFQDLPTAFDTYLLNEKEQFLTDTLNFKNPSNAMRLELISENVFFDSDRAFEANGNKKVKLYAPTSFNSGSSIYHFDDKTYPAGTANSLMTPTAGLREINYDPGPVALKVMYELGWRSTSILHTGKRNLETATTVPLKVRIVSDTTIKAETAVLKYAFANLNSGSIDVFNESLINDPIILPLTAIAGTDSFMVELPVDDNFSLIGYRFSVEDNYGETVETGNFTFTIGEVDEFGPEIEYVLGEQIIGTRTNYTIIASVTDEFDAGIDTVFVNYQINGGATSQVGLRKFNNLTDTLYSQGRLDATTYLNYTDIPFLADGDILTYSITSIDKKGNISKIPQTEGEDFGIFIDDVYTVTGTVLNDPVDGYRNNFDNLSIADFALNGFEIVTPAGLTSGALVTSTPYKNGLGQAYGPDVRFAVTDFDYNAYAMLKSPIVINLDSSIIHYDEIVLVEPGDDNGFWDFVIVQASFDYGANWFNIVNGYDANSEEVWFDTFSNYPNVDNPTSTGVPTTAMFRSRDIDLKDVLDDSFNGAEMLIRFKLYADRYVNGYGWVIDNLSIQKEVERPLASAEEMDIFNIYPNPSTEYIDINAKVSEKDAKLQIYSMNGRKVYDTKVLVNEGVVTERVITKGMPAGSYIATIKTEKGLINKRFVIVD